MALMITATLWMNRSRCVGKVYERECGQLSQQYQSDSRDDTRSPVGTLYKQPAALKSMRRFEVVEMDSLGIPATVSDNWRRNCFSRSVKRLIGTAMNIMNTNRSRLLAVAFTVAAMLALGAPAAQANEVHIAGFTAGVFDQPESSLTYSSSTFDVTSVGGEAYLTNLAASPNFNNLGSFTLSANGPEVIAGDTFTLQLTFTVPSGISGGGFAAFTA